MTSAEFQEWKAFYLVEPFGNTREDHRTGIIAATIANVHGKKGTRLKPTDFFPEYRARRQEWEEQLQIVEMLNIAFGGKDKRQPVDV